MKSYSKNNPKNFSRSTRVANRVFREQAYRLLEQAEHSLDLDSAQYICREELEELLEWYYQRSFKIVSREY